MSILILEGPSILGLKVSYGGVKKITFSYPLLKRVKSDLYKQNIPYINCIIELENVTYM